MFCVLFNLYSFGNFVGENVKLLPELILRIEGESCNRAKVPICVKRLIKRPFRLCAKRESTVLW